MLENVELLMIKAITALINNSKPLAASSLKNHLNGDEIYLNIYYLTKSIINNLISFNVRKRLFKIVIISG